MADKKLSRRDFLKAASTALAASGFAALPVGLVRAQDDEISLELWGFANNRDEWMHNVVDELWSDMHPNVSVSLSLTPYSDLWPKLQAAFVAGAGIPDMVDIEISAMGQFVRDAGSEPYAALNDHIGEQLDDLSIPSATKPWTVRGNIYGVGNEVNPVLLYYRHDIFDELGMDAEAPGTWDEFVDMLGGGAMDAGHGLFPFRADSWSDFYTQFHQAGGEFGFVETAIAAAARQRRVETPARRFGPVADAPARAAERDQRTGDWPIDADGHVEAPRSDPAQDDKDPRPGPGVQHGRPVRDDAAVERDGLIDGRAAAQDGQPGRRTHEHHVGCRPARPCRRRRGERIDHVAHQVEAHDEHRARVGRHRAAAADQPPQTERDSQPQRQPASEPGSNAMLHTVCSSCWCSGQGQMASKRRRKVAGRNITRGAPSGAVAASLSTLCRVCSSRRANSSRWR